MDRLPSEVILYIITCINPFFITQPGALLTKGPVLDPVQIVKLQLVCRRFLSIARDNNLWRRECFQSSSFLENLCRRRAFVSGAPVQEARFRDLQRALGGDEQERASTIPRKINYQSKPNEHVRLLANWDPSYPSEKIDWYSEFIHRSAPIAISWLQQPSQRDTTDRELLEVRGIGIYNSADDPDSSLAVGPLDDGSICLWDLRSSSSTQGKIINRSSSGTLNVSGHSHSDSHARSKMINTGVTECVTVDSLQKKAYFAIQSDLVEVDLETLKAVGRETFPFSISALSNANHPVPITVGTSLSLHLHDPRAHRLHQQNSDTSERIDPPPQGGSISRRTLTFRNIFDPHPSPNYAPLFQPGPLSILHLPSSGENWNGNGDIYVAGRFSSILNYDRRTFPKLRGTIHSGARLSSLTSIPFPFAARENDLMRRGELSLEEVQAAKNLPGSTLIAGGEYNTKGSLEFYGLSPLPQLSNGSSYAATGKVQTSVLHNRQTSSSSKLLSVACHGTRIVFSDGGGNIKWVERDGFTEVRRWNLANNSVEAPRGIFGSIGDTYMDSGSGDIVRKILNVNQAAPVNEGGLLLWTGEKIGLLSFSTKPLFSRADFEETAKSLEEAHREREEREYEQTMRRALERQADEVRFVRGLGLGLDFT